MRPQVWYAAELERDPRQAALFLRLSGDPDFHVFYSSACFFAKGVSLGVNEKLPRTPAVFERKRKWWDYSGEQEPNESVRCNYPAAGTHADVIEDQFLAEETRCHASVAHGRGH